MLYHNQVYFSHLSTDSGRCLAITTDLSPHYWRRLEKFRCRFLVADIVSINHIQGVPKNALSELPFYETGFEGIWPSTASWRLNCQWKAAYLESVFLLRHPVVLSNFLRAMHLI